MPGQSMAFKDQCTLVAGVTTLFVAAALPVAAQELEPARAIAVMIVPEGEPLVTPDEEQ